MQNDTPIRKLKLRNWTELCIEL